MANTKSQEHRIHRSEREHAENRTRTSAVKTYFRRLEEAVGSGNGVDDAYRKLVSTIDKAAEHGALHANNAARKKSRAARIRARAS